MSQKLPPARIIKYKNKILITNLKCMYSSINSLENKENYPKDSPECEKIMLYRKTNVRVISCFLNWMIRDPLSKNVLAMREEEIIRDNLWLIKKMCQTKKFDLNTYKILVSQLNDDQNLIHLFKIYIDLLPLFFKSDLHTVPQNNIVIESGLKVDKFINIDNPSELHLLESILEVKFPLSNPSKNEDKDLLLKFLHENISYQEKIRNIYQNDFDFVN